VLLEINGELIQSVVGMQYVVRRARRGGVRRHENEMDDGPLEAPPRSSAVGR